MNQKLQMATRGILIFALVIPTVSLYLPFIQPIFLAIFFAFAAESMLKKFTTRARRKRYFAPALFVAMLVLFILPFGFFSIHVISVMKNISTQSLQDSQFFRSIFAFWDIVQGYGLRVIDILGVGSDLLLTKDELFRSANPFLIEKTKLILSSLPEFGLSLCVFFSFLILFSTRADSIRDAFLRSEILPAEELNHMTTLLKSSCHFILASTILIGAIQAFIVALGSLIFGYNEFFLIFAVTFLLSFIPIVGAAPIALVLATFSFINHEAGSGLGMMVVAIIAGTIDNVLKPYLFAGESKNLHPLVSLFGIIGALLIFGISGLLLGPLLLQISLDLGPLLMRSLLQPQTLKK